MLKVHTKDSAPPASKATLEAVERRFGMVPNLFGVFADSPAALKGYTAIAEAFADSGLSPAERQIVLIAASIENGCDYCVGAHSTIAKGAHLFDDGTLEALRDGRPLGDPRQEALRRFTIAVVRERGWVASGEIQAFLAEGFEPAQALDVLASVAMKTLSNYTNHIAETPLDPAFEGQRWEAPALT